MDGKSPAALDVDFGFGKLSQSQTGIQFTDRSYSSPTVGLSCQTRGEDEEKGKGMMS